MSAQGIVSATALRQPRDYRHPAGIRVPARGRALRVTALVAFALVGVASRSASAQTYILNEGFTQTASPTTATPILHVMGGYTGPGGVTYTADAYWANQDCNGLLSAWNQSSTDIGGLPGAQCGTPASNRYGWAFSQQLAQALGQLNGQTQLQARNNFAVSAYTLSSAAAAGGIELQSSQVPMSTPIGGTGRFVMFSVDVAAANCTAPGNPLLQFYLLNAANVQTAVGSQINACALTTTFPTEARGTLPAASHRAGRYPTSVAILHLGTTVGMRLRNQTVFANGDGNDHAFDNIRIIDASPTVSKAFGSATTVVGQAVPLTFTITNTPDNLQKQGWSFIDTLPTGLVVATPNGVSTTCTGSTVLAVAGTGLISVTNGNLPAGATCAITVNVVSQAPGTYTNGASNIAPSTGLNLPPSPATVTVLPAPILRLQKALPMGRAEVADQFTLRIGSGATIVQSATTTGATNAPTQVATLSPATAGTAYTLSEIGAGGASLSNYTTAYSCANTLAGGQAPSGTGTSFNVTPVGGDDLTCTFTNTRRSRLTLIKTVTNDDTGTQLPTAWTLSATGPVTITGTTGSAAVTNAVVSAGTYTLSESALPAGYSATPYSCAINGGALVSGNSVTLATGDSAVCRIHNDDNGVPGQPAACGITSHSGANGASFAFGPGGVNASASLQNIAFEAGSTAGGSLNRFVDSTGRSYSTPAGPGRWLLTNSNSTTRVTVTFSPAIPAHRIGLAIYDIGTWDAAPGSEDPTYTPSLTLALTGGATSSQFVAHPTGPLSTLARYTPATGIVTMDNTVYQPGVERTWRQSAFLRGNANALVSTLTLTATNIKQGDAIGFGLVAIPSCVTIGKVTEGGVGTFNFTTTNLNNWNNTAAASPVVLTTSAPGTSASSVRHLYAHPISSANQGTQPVTLTEAIPSGWVLSPAQCTDANSGRNGNTGSFGTLAGGTLTIPADRMRFESNITCMFTNTLAETDVRVEKTASADPVASGSVVTYTIGVNNDGPAPAHGTVLTDTPGAGLNCTAPSVTLVCTATGGAACPSATVPVSTLTGSGMTIPTLPAGGRVTATVQCTVNATGQP